MTTVQGKSFIWQSQGRFCVAVHGDSAPGDEQWDAVLAEYRARSAVRVLVHAEGGSPTPAQRVRLTAALKGREVAVAVLTASPLARAAGIAVRWFRPEIRILSPAEIEAALDYLGAKGSERSELERTLAELKSMLGVPVKRASL